MFNYSKFADKCRDELPLKEATSNYKVTVNFLPICILDAVFSIGVNYRSVVNVVNRYIDYFHIDFKRESGGQKEHTVDEFITNIESVGGPVILATDILKNRQRTSTSNGVLKAEACYMFAKLLHDLKINTLKDFFAFKDKDYLDYKIKSLPGQSSGIMLNYFYMLAGDTTRVKEDRWVFRFVQEAIPEVKTLKDVDDVFQHAVEILKEEYPNITISLLDNVIWTYMSKFK